MPTKKETKVESNIESKLNGLASQREQIKHTVMQVLTEMFTNGEWEIPDDAVEGKLTARVQQLEARVTAQSNRIAELQAKLDGKPGPVNRADALAEKSESKGRK